MSSQSAQHHEIEENAFLSDRDLLTLANENNLILILPHPAQKEFLEYYQGLFGQKNLKILVPRQHTGQTCLDAMNDPEVITAIKQAANQTKRLELTSYTASHQFISLVKFLRKQGVLAFVPEAPEEHDLWTVNFYGSKSGIRQLAQQSSAAKPDLQMSPGLVCSGIYDAAQIAANVYLKESGVVIKTNKGHSGAGVYILRPGELPIDHEQCQAHILTLLKKDAYWAKTSIVVEELININQTVGGGSPSVEFKIAKTGKVEFLYYGGMRVTSAGVFKGMEIHKDILSDMVAAQIIDTGFFIGKHYASQGYRGYFDVDFVAAKNGKLYVTESNVRRTGGTYVFHASCRLFGPDFFYETCVISNNLYPLQSKKQLTFSQLLTQLRPILFDKKTKEGVVLAAANLLKHQQIAYIIYGQTSKRVLAIEAQMEALLNQPVTV